MRIDPLLACSVVLAALASAQAVSVQNRPAASGAPSVTTNSPALAVAEQADRLIKEMSAYIGSANDFTFHAEESGNPQNPPRSVCAVQQSKAEDKGINET